MVGLACLMVALACLAPVDVAAGEPLVKPAALAGTDAEVKQLPLVGRSALPPGCKSIFRRIGEVDVDWGAREVVVHGFGRPRALSPLSSLIEGDLGQQAALAARARLDEELRLLPLDAEQTVGDAAVSSPVLASALSGVVAGLEAWQVQTLSDGTVVWLGRAGLGPLLRAAPAVRPPVRGAGVERLFPDALRPVEPVQRSPHFSGLLVDARKLKDELQPVLLPSVRGPGGQLLLRPAGPPAYCPGPGDELAVLLGDHPLQVRAVGSWGRQSGDVVLGQADAAAVEASFPEGSAALVVLVTAGTRPSLLVQGRGGRGPGSDEAATREVP